MRLGDLRRDIDRYRRMRDALTISVVIHGAAFMALWWLTA